MTRIDFHSNVGDSLLYACRLVRKAYQAGQPHHRRGRAGAPARFRRTVVDLFRARLRAALHGRHAARRANADRAGHESRRRPASSGAAQSRARRVPAQFARFERLLEVVGNAHDELAAGRERYRFYRDRGYALNNYKQGG